MMEEKRKTCDVVIFDNHEKSDKIQFLYCCEFDLRVKILYQKT
tara:strand:- start:439 stop:567 length:129 start_codon:yes stop_codon:yes gene_type:complete